MNAIDRVIKNTLVNNDREIIAISLKQETLNKIRTTMKKEGINNRSKFIEKIIEEVL